MKFCCPECDYKTDKKSELLKHQRSANHWKKLNCNICGKVFSRKDNLDRHVHKHRNENSFHCSECGCAFSREDNLFRHLRDKHQVGGGRKRTGTPTSEVSAPKLRKITDVREHYNLRKVNEWIIKKFRTKSSTYKVTFNNLEVVELQDILITLKALFSSIFNEVTKGSKSKDLVRIVVQTPTLDYPIVIPFGPVTALTADRFLQEVERVLQSNEDFVINESLEFEITLVDMPSGGAQKRCKFVNNDRFLLEKKCIIRINNSDSICCARAIVTEAENKIYLYYQEEHFDVITSMSAFLTRNYFCTMCNRGYDHKDKHVCNNICASCRKVHEKNDSDEWIHCEKCNRYFQGQECFDLHAAITYKGNSTCNTYYRCTECSTTINRKMHKKDHVCGERYCETCKIFVSEMHQCFMLPEDNAGDMPMSIEEELINEEETAKTFIFFDFECTQEDMVACNKGYIPDSTGLCSNCNKTMCGSFEHKPNLCVAHKVCTKCMQDDVTSTSQCENCDKNEHIFKGSSTLDEFCLWLFSEENFNTTVICHNFQGYDSYPILQYLYRNAIVPKIVPNGAKVMSLVVESCKVKMIDSINFIPMALAKLPAMFGIEELKKGYFPHLYNQMENQAVVLDRLPDVKYYNPDSMKPFDRQAFLKWHEENKDKPFHFQSELLEYCRSDVDILRRGCLTFRDNFMSITNIDPFEQCITIASACNLVFRTNFLKQNSIGIIPHHGYKPEQMQSVKALQWIQYLSHSQGHQIQHARNGGEKQIGPYMVDGYYETVEGEKVVLEFHGDFWHGNPTKYSSSTVNPVRKLTMGELYQKTLDKKKYLEENGYTYVSIWESEFEQQMIGYPVMMEFIKNCQIITPLQPRDAFFGGRTEAFTLYKEASSVETIKYYDVTSLYPFINKTGKVPLGHPTIITENFGQLTDYEGLIKCKVIPPRHLFHPVLPCKVNGKLLFHMCKSCAEVKNEDTSPHTDEQRSFVGTWVTDELKKATKKGYQIATIYEVWHFENVSQYDPNTMKGGVFAEYVNTFLKLKQEASGWPSWCTTEELKRKYITQYHEKEGVWLDYENIRKNPGMRALAKLMLNSFWGKFGQRSNMSQVEIVNDPAVYFNKLTSEKEEVTCVNYVSDDLVEMRWKYKNDFVDTSAKTNVIIAAYTTAQARLKLYSYLEPLAERALYADTDSVIFATKEGEWVPHLGDYLGDLTDEVSGNAITTFITGGPKNYAFRLKEPDESGKQTHCKIRGVTLNYRGLQTINFNVMKTMVFDNSKQSITVKDPFKISRDRNSTKLVTMSQNKDYRLVFDKRVIRENYTSYPY